MLESLYQFFNTNILGGFGICRRNCMFLRERITQPDKRTICQKMKFETECLKILFSVIDRGTYTCLISILMQKRRDTNASDAKFFNFILETEYCSHRGYSIIKGVSVLLLRSATLWFIRQEKLQALPPRIAEVEKTHLSL